MDAAGKDSAETRHAEIKFDRGRCAVNNHHRRHDIIHGPPYTLIQRDTGVYLLRRIEEPRQMRALVAITIRMRA